MTKGNTFSELDVVTMLCCFAELFRNGHEETFLKVAVEDDRESGIERKPGYYDGVKDCYKFSINLIDTCAESISTYYGLDFKDITQKYDPLEVGNRVCAILYDCLENNPGTVADGPPVHD